jgi:hypothetical protein
MVADHYDSVQEQKKAGRQILHGRHLTASLLENGWQNSLNWGRECFHDEHARAADELLKTFESEQQSIDTDIRFVVEALTALEDEHDRVSENNLWQILHSQTGLQKGDKLCRLEANGRVTRFYVDNLYLFDGTSTGEKPRLHLSGRKYNAAGSILKTNDGLTFSRFAELDEAEGVMSPRRDIKAVADMTIAELCAEVGANAKSDHPSYRSRLYRVTRELQWCLESHGAQWHNSSRLSRIMRNVRGEAGLVIRNTGETIVVELCNRETPPGGPEIGDQGNIVFGSQLLHVSNFAKIFDGEIPFFHGLSAARRTALAVRATEIACRLALETVAQFGGWVAEQTPIRWQCGSPCLVPPSNAQATWSVGVTY